MNVEEIGKALAEAGRLDSHPLCVYGCDSPPPGAYPVTNIDRCLGKAIYTLAVKEGPMVAYIGQESKAGCCPGGQAWLGLTPFPERIKHFVSTGTPDFRSGEGEYLKRSPELVEESVLKLGDIKMPAEILVIQRTEGIESDRGLLCMILFGKAENIRNLCTLHHFGTSDAMASIVVPWGPTCASLVTYPSGMASNAPKESVFLGPTDPTGNSWFPPDQLSMAIPMGIARRMAEDVKRSFIEKRKEVAYPTERVQRSEL